MAKRIIFALSVIISLFFIQPIYALDSCFFQVTIDSADVDLDNQFFTLDVYFENDCSIGGMQFEVTTNPPGVIVPYDVDFTGSRVADWEYYNVNISPDTTTMKFFGVANMPSGGDQAPLSPGSGKIFTMHYKYRCHYVSGLKVAVHADSVLVTDSTGHTSVMAAAIDGEVELGGDPTMRGDANCDNRLIGSDVTYLVNYFRGILGCPCSVRAGDANSDGFVRGSDVTFLVNYFRGIGPHPGE